MDHAFKHGKKVIVEEFIEGREIRVGVIPWRVINNIDAPIDQKETKTDELFVTPFLEYLIPKDVKIRTE